MRHLDRRAGTMLIDSEASMVDAPALRVVPTLPVHGFEYVEGTGGWIVTVADRYLRSRIQRMPELETFGRAARVKSLHDQGWLETSIDTIKRLDHEWREEALGGVIAVEACISTPTVALATELKISKCIWG